MQLNKQSSGDTFFSLSFIILIPSDPGELMSSFLHRMVRPRLTIYVCQESQQLRDQQKHEDGDAANGTFFGKDIGKTAFQVADGMVVFCNGIISSRRCWPFGDGNNGIRHTSNQCCSFSCSSFLILLLLNFPLLFICLILI